MESLIRKGVDFYQNGQFKAALDIFKNVMEQNVLEETMLLLMTDIYVHFEHYENAFRYGLLAHQHFPSLKTINNVLFLLTRKEDIHMLIKLSKTKIETYGFCSQTFEYLISKMSETYHHALEAFDLLDTYYQQKIIQEPYYKLITNWLVYTTIVFYRDDVLERIEKMYEKKTMREALTNTALTPTDFSLWMAHSLSPKILYVSQEEIDSDYTRIVENMDNLVEIVRDRNLVPFSDVKVLLFHFIRNFNYYHCYHGKPVKPVLEKFHCLLKKVCPNLGVSTIPIVNETFGKNTKIRIAFYSDYLIQNQSVCQDRIGVVKYFSELEDEFQVFILAERDVFGDLYKQIMCASSYTNFIKLSHDFTTAKSQIASLKLHVLVYPEIGMNVNPYIMSFYRLAPLQINTWGHSETSGQSTIDYYFSSKWFHDDPTYFTEKLVEFSSLCTCYFKRQPPFYPDPLVVRYGFQMFPGYRYYGILNTCIKLHPCFMDMIGRVMEADRQAVFFFISYPYCEVQLGNFLQRTLPLYVHRIRVLKVIQDLSMYRQLIRELDFFIDSYPFGGCNTTLDCFQEGKIVLTIPYERIHGMFTCGFYKKLGITEPVCKDVDDMVEKIQYYIQNPEEKKALEKRIYETHNTLFMEISSCHDWVDTIKTLYKQKKGSFHRYTSLKEIHKKKQIKKLHETMFYRGTHSLDFLYPFHHYLSRLVRSNDKVLEYFPVDTATSAILACLVREVHVIDPKPVHRLQVLHNNGLEAKIMSELSEQEDIDYTVMITCRPTLPFQDMHHNLRLIVFFLLNEQSDSHTELFLLDRGFEKKQNDELPHVTTFSRNK